MKQKTLITIVLGLLCLCCPSVSAYDFSAVNKDGVTIYYNIIGESVVEVTSNHSDYTGIIRIPSSVYNNSNGSNYTVRRIGDLAFENCSSLTSVKIPNSVTEIGVAAFDDCSSLTSIDIPNTVTYIENCAFDGCSSLTSVEIPNSVTQIGWSAFSRCSSLTYVEIPNSVTEIRDGTFEYCSSLTSVEIPNSVTQIESRAFEGCSSLTSVEIPNSVTQIGEWAFEGCSSLTSVEIPNSVTQIGEWAFEGCSSLTSVEIPNSVTEIGSSPFKGCGSLKCFTGKYASPDSRCLVIDGVLIAFARANLTSYSIPNSVTHIDVYAFEDCNSLTSVEIPNSVTIIGWRAFSDCSGLISVEIPNSVTEIGYGAFSGCSSLISVEIPSSVTEIEHDTFYGCRSLTSVEIPSSVTQIGDYAFYGCRSLTSVEIPNTVTQIGDDAFLNCSSLTSVEIPNSVTEIGSWVFGCCSSLERFTGKYASPDSRCLIKDGSLIAFAPANLTSYSIPNSVTKIGAYAFYGCSSLTSVEIPNSVTKIEYDAFSGCCSLTSVEIPNPVTSIGGGAFSDCSSLTSIKLRNNNPSNISLGYDAFYGVNKYTCTLYVPIGSKELYAASYDWREFSNIIESGAILTHGDSYNQTIDYDDECISYSRTFDSEGWQPLYLPFNMSYEEWSEFADVAEIYNVRGVDNDKDGVIDETVLEFNKLTHGELIPNTPYIIRPKHTGDVTFECNGKTLKAAPEVNGTVDCSSTKSVYTLTGVYQPTDNLTDNLNYVMRDGAFELVEDDAICVNPFEIYLTVTPKNGGYQHENGARVVSATRPQKVRISIVGEDIFTSVDAIETDADNGCWYDMLGNKVDNPSNGIFIRNGRKVILK